MQTREYTGEFKSKNVQFFQTLQNMPEIDLERYIEYLKELFKSFESQFNDFKIIKKHFVLLLLQKNIDISDIKEIG